MVLYNMIGYKLFKENEDGSIHMVRIVNMRKPYKITPSTKDPDEITIFDYDTNEKRKVRVAELKEYSPLKPDGIFTASVVYIRDSKGKVCKDVIVTATKFLNIEYKVSNIPYAVCRQNITDIFYNILCADESQMLVGLAVNQDTCPSNFDFRIMFAADSIEFSDFINFYRTDTLEDILKMINMKKYDDALRDLYLRHVKVVNDPKLNFMSEHGGWCKDLKTLLKVNNFQADINQMLGITDVDFIVNDYLDEKPLPGREGETYTVANDELKSWLSLTYKLNMSEVSILEFDHDINLGDFNNATYLLLRDKSKKLYLAVYTVEGEFYEKDLEEKAKELDFSTKFRIKFYDKYNKSNNN